MTISESIIYYDYFNKLLRLENIKVIFKTRQDSLHSCHHNLDIVSKLYRNIVSINVFNIEAIQYNIKINLAISCSHIIKVFLVMGLSYYVYEVRMNEERKNKVSLSSLV